MLSRTWQMILALLALPLCAAAATLPPESAVELDLRWLSPPQVSPQTGAANAEMHDDFTRLTTRFVAEGASFTWPLRYVVSARQYPIVVLRYTARDLFAAADDQTVLQMNLASADGRSTPAIIIEMRELVQDGVVHEIRKDLSRVAGDTAIDSIRFSFNGTAGGGRLDIHELRFEPGASGVAPFQLPREAVQFVVTDAAGNAVPDAEVRAGLIERSNWTTVGTTDAAGMVTMSVIRPVRPDGTAADPVEAMVLKDGFVPQYVAPIEFPRTGPMAVKLTPAAAQGTPEASSAVPIGQEPDRTVYIPSQTTVVYDTSPSVVYVEQYAPYWWVPRTYVGYHPYYHYYYDRSHFGYENWRFHDRGFRRVDDRGGDHGRDFDRGGDHNGRDGGRDGGRDARGPQMPPPPVTPREQTRDRIRQEVDRGNEPATGIEDSAIYRRAEKNPRGTPAPAPVAADRGDRYRPADRGRGNEPDPRPNTSVQPRVEAPRAVPGPGPRPERVAPAPAPRPERTAPAPAPSAGRAPASPAPDRGDRYQRDDRGRGNEPAPRSAAPWAGRAQSPAVVSQPRPAPSVAAPRQSAPVIEPTMPARVEPSMPARVERSMPARVESSMPRRIESPSMAEQIRRGNEPAAQRAGARIEVAAPRSAGMPGRMDGAAPRSEGGSMSGDRGGRYSR